MLRFAFDPIPFGLCALLALAGGGCSCEPPPDGTATTASGPVTSAVPLDTSDVLHNHLRTTDPTIALANLDSQAKETERLLGEQPDNPALHKKTVTLLLQRAGITGSARDRSHALELADAFAKSHPEMPDAIALRARALASMHRFDESTAALDEADKLSKAPGAFSDLRMANDAAQGRYDAVYPAYKAEADRHPSASSLLALATVAAKMGKLDEAEAAFVRSEELFRGATPFMLATIYFERASMWERAGDLAKATILYRAAHDRLPQHVHAAVHLATLVAPTEGVSILEPLAEGEADPDLLAELGVLRNLVAAKSGDEALARARARYEQLMAEQPAAYADHAGWYWLSVGNDPAKALDAAKQNLAVRKTAEAYELAISAAQAGGSNAELCSFVNAASALAYPSAKLRELLRPLDCPKDAAASASASAGPSARPAPSSAAGAAPKKPAP